MPSARTVVLYTLLWARPERLGAGFSCGGRKMALTAPGSLMAAPACWDEHVRARLPLPPALIEAMTSDRADAAWVGLVHAVFEGAQPLVCLGMYG